MNLFLPCTHDARAEVKELMMVSKNIVSPQSNRPVMSIVQDALLACSKLTRRDVFLDKARFTNIMSHLGLSYKDLPLPCIHKPKPLWSGKQLFSLAMPNDCSVSLDRYSAEHDDIDPDVHSYNFADTVVQVQSGELISGILCKKTLGTSSGGLVHKIWTEVSPEAACDFISNVQFMVNNWLVENGFSVGISDCVNQPNDQQKVNSIVKASIDEAHKVPANLPADVYEHSMNQILNRARDTSGRLVQQQMNASNNLYSMVSGGSKGSVINIAQIMACVGQQNVNGQRISHGYDERTLPHFKRKDNTPEGRGFVQHSYMQGLQPHEFFFHAMGGREGVIDTAIKTSDSGYTQRRLVKAMEDITVHFDGTVRNSIGDIIQFKYGEDNMDGSKLIPQSVNGKKIYLPLDLKDSIQHRPHLFGRFTTENKELTQAFNEALKHMDMSAHDSYVLHRTQDAKISPGEMVGIIAAQSLGQPITQMTLNTFHFAGCSSMNVTLGVPRLKELINVSKNIKSPSMRIKPLDPDFHASELCGVYMKDLILRGQILEKLDSPVFEKTYIRMMDNETFQQSIDQTDWSIRYEMDVPKLHTHGLDLLDITVWINKTFNHVWCSCSDENAVNPTVIVRLFVNNNGLDVYPKMKQLYCKMTQDTVIQGYKNITQVLVNDEGYIETLGIDMENVMANARVNPYKTRCNDVITTYNTLGIEAVRQVLYDEICKVIEFDGSYVDYRHTAMLIDTMTYKGSLMAITRHGINRTETGVLMRCSFEETVNVITDAATFGEYDPIRGVTENIIMGKMACLGTGTMDIMMDTEKFMNSFQYSNQIPNEFVPSNPVKYEEFDETFVPE